MRINYLVAVMFFTVSVYNHSHAGIIFEDNFDTSPDWQSHQTINKGSGGEDIVSFDYNCTTLCPPARWNAYRAPSSHWDDDRRLDTFILDSNGKRGPAGKGITYNIESTGDSSWSGGSLNLWLGHAGYSELYIRMWIKVQPGFDWYDPAIGKTSTFKLMRVSSYDDYTVGNSIGDFSSGLDANNPVFFPDIYYHPTFGDGIHANWWTATRTSPDYAVPGNASDATRYSDGSLPTSDGGWHCYEIYVKMNSADDVADGEYKMWIDATGESNVFSHQTGVVFKKTGSDHTRNWNWLFFLDNATINNALLSAHIEQSVQMDDVVVSTSYIGKDYVIGNGAAVGQRFRFRLAE